MSDAITRYNLKPGWTKQKILDLIYKNNNGEVCFEKRSENDPAACVFLSEKGNRCFIGCLIPDGHDALIFADGNVDNLLIDYPDLKEHMPFDDVHALREFQSKHDDYFQDCEPALDDVREEAKRWLDCYVEDPHEATVV